MRAQPCLDAMKALLPLGSSVLDVGSGDGRHAEHLRGPKPTRADPLRTWPQYDVTTIDQFEGADISADFVEHDFDGRTFDAIWACHVLEHVANVGQFIDKVGAVCRPGGFIAISVPPRPANDVLVSGHVSLWTPGVLVYNMVKRGIDCSDARLFVHNYNISILVRNVSHDAGDLGGGADELERLSQFFPVPVRQRCDGWLGFSKLQGT